MGTESERIRPPLSGRSENRFVVKADKGSYPVPAIPMKKKIQLSFKSREKKRRYKLAIKKNRTDREEMAGRHYLTIVSRSCCCNACGDSLREGYDCVYRYEPREILCLRCATNRKLRYRPSLKWERRKAKEERRKRASR